MGELFSMERLLGIFEKIWYFFVINFLFILSNIPLLGFLLFVGIGQVSTYYMLFMVCLLPLPPAFSAVLYTMGRQLRGTEITGFKDYKKGYVEDFWTKFKLGLLHIFMMTVFWTNAKFLSQYGFTLLSMFFYVTFLFSIILTPNLYILASRYKMKVFAIMKTAIIVTVVRPVCTLGYVAAFAVFLILLEITAGTTILFIISGYGFLVVFISSPILKLLEESQ